MVLWVKKREREGEKRKEKRRKEKRKKAISIFFSFLVTLNKSLISKMCNNIQDPVSFSHNLSYYFGATINNSFPENTRSFENGTLLIKYTIRTFEHINANYNH